MVTNIMQSAGIELISVSPQEAEAQMPVEPNLQPYGVLHGGASALLAESVASWAGEAHAQTLNKIAVGTELSISHLRAVKDGYVHAQATAQHLGKRSATYLITIQNDEGVTVATARLTCAILELPAPQ